ncbi:hypothetical protein [Paraburkholderia caribensis]|uniref:hypothetical protein n=1 Tax=Paraburkholderia caribensis TaxID=75105 RepID=UPI001D08B1CF|nr:hypothetical protein [Paraburkholderia caribensis]
MTLIIGFIVSHLGAILGGIVAAGGVLFGFVTKKNADTKVAQAGQQVAQAQATTAQAQEQVAQTNNAEAQANAAAAQAGAQATKERSDAESTVDALPAGGAAQQLLDEWARPGEDAGRGGAGSAGQDPNR